MFVRDLRSLSIPPWGQLASPCAFCGRQLPGVRAIRQQAAPHSRETPLQPRCGEKPEIDWDSAWKNVKKNIPKTDQRPSSKQRLPKAPQQQRAQRPDPVRQQESTLADLWTSNAFFVGGAAVTLLLLVIYLLAALDV